MRERGEGNAVFNYKEARYAVVGVGIATLNHEEVRYAVAGVGNAELNHEEVKRAAAQAGERLFRLVCRLILAADLQNK